MKNKDLIIQKQKELIDILLGSHIDWDNVDLIRAELAQLESELDIDDADHSEKVKCFECRFFKSESYHGAMWCRDCRQYDRFSKQYGKPIIGSETDKSANNLKGGRGEERKTD